MVFGRTRGEAPYFSDASRRSLARRLRGRRAGGFAAGVPEARRAGRGDRLDGVSVGRLDHGPAIRSRPAARRRPDQAPHQSVGGGSVTRGPEDALHRLAVVRRGTVSDRHGRPGARRRPRRARGGMAGNAHRPVHGSGQSRRAELRPARRRPRHAHAGIDFPGLVQRHADKGRRSGEVPGPRPGGPRLGRQRDRVPAPAARPLRPSRPVRPGGADAGLRGSPGDGKFWYTDGGTVDNEPLGRTIELAQSVGSDDNRVFLLIHPDPAATTDTASPTWTEDSPQPSWLHAGTRAFTIGRTQTIFEDLKRLEKTNTHLEWAKSIPAAVEAGVTEAIARLGLSAAQADTLRASLQDAAEAELGRIRQSQADVRNAAGRAPREREQAIGDYAATVRALVAAATGLEGKKPASVDVVSPGIGPAVTEPASAQLAGAFLFHFGGFVDIRFRRSDFALGYRNMQYWLEHDLARRLEGLDLSGALTAVADGYRELGWDGIRFGGAQLGSLSVREKFQLGEVGEHLGRVLAHDL